MDYIDDFCKDLAARGRRRTTIETYRAVLGIITRHLEAMGMETAPPRIGEAEVYAVAGGRWKESTRRLYVHILTGWCDHYGNGIPHRMKLLWNDTEPSVCWIEPEDYRRLLRAAPPSERIAMILGAMLGLRAMEITDTRLDDLLPEGIRVRGKGHGNGKLAVQPVPPEVRAEIDRYLRWRSRQHPDTDRLLIWRHGGERTDTLVYPTHALARNLGRLGDRYGIKLTPHALRRLYATTLWRQGTDLLTISRLMRHANVETTRRYIQADRTAELRAASALAQALE